jgi:response regulator RpfG family c-di-GMP phosphodiesterase
MPSAAFEPEWAMRLSGQLETLSELAESLTYRVLELEERLAQQELHLSSLQLASEELTSGVGEAIEERMLETDHRLARIEGLLQGQGRRTSSPRSLRAVPKASPRHPLGQSSADDTPEEVVFLDDLSQEPAYEDEPIDPSLAS